MPSGYSAKLSRSDMHWSARRVFPQPPEPVKVKRRVMVSKRLTSRTCCSRPIKLLTAAGRLSILGNILVGRMTDVSAATQALVIFDVRPTRYYYTPSDGFRSRQILRLCEVFVRS